MKIIPVPKKITMGEGTLSLKDARIAVDAKCDIRITKAAVTLKGEIEAVAGCFVKLGAALGKPSDKAVYVAEGVGGDEGYTLKVTKDGVEILGNSAAGAFYAIQTLRQMIKEYGIELPVCEIEDRPDFASRGFYHDITRGRVTTLETMKKITAQLAYFKINELQLYVEDAFYFKEFEGIITTDECMTAEEMTELDDFCYNNFIELVPSLSTFGHLYTLLQSEKWRHLCEYENWQPYHIFWLEKQAHHTLDVSHPGSIEIVKSMIDQYVPLFRSKKFNICCDETFDLCKEKNKDKDAGEEYFKFVAKIIEHVKSYGKEVQMWGDIVLEHVEQAKAQLSDVMMLTWNYTKVPNEEMVKVISEAGLKQIICPGTSSWNRFIEEIDRSLPNITGLAQYGYKYGAEGILNTNWGDFGNICSWNCEMYGMVIGAEAGWNPSKKNIDEDFEMAASLLLYNCADKNIVRLIYDMGMCERTCDWMEFMYWYSANTKENRVTLLPVDCEKAIENNVRIDEIAVELKDALEEGPILTDLILACRAIKMINKVALMIADHPDYQDRPSIRAEWRAWFVDYKQAWLRDDKVSQVERIGQVVDTFADLPCNSSRKPIDDGIERVVRNT